MSRVVAPSAIRVPISLGYERVAHMERELLADTGDRRLLPYMSLHEFEAIVFVSPTTVAADTSSMEPTLAFVEAYNPKGGFDLRRATGPSNKELKLTKRG